MVVLVMMAIAVGVVVLVMRAAAAQAGPNATPRPARPAHRPKAAHPTRPMAPDDDPDFLRELERRARRDDGAPS
jgi:cell division protein FtsN